MNKQLLLDDFAQLFDEDISNLNDDYILDEDGNWDSLSVVSTVGAIDQHYQVAVSGIDLMNCQRISDVFKLIEHALASEVV